MKKTFRFLTVFCLMMCIALCAFSAHAADGDIEIKFAVGDSILSINGQDVTVTTPYVVDGTTLVPVRVITEAFGATVSWNADEQSVTVTYSDVVIKLAIGNKTAYVNDTAVELLAAPELTNSTTMLPLRFITESFGADVTYDEATAKITVIKQMTTSNSIKDYSLILKRSNKEFVGDSFLNWSMAHSPEMKLSYRSFDGTANIFTNKDDSGVVEVSSVTFSKDETITDVYNLYRENSKDYSVSKFEKAKSPSGIEYVVIQYSTSTGYYEQRTYKKDKKGFSVTAALDIKKEREEFDALTEIISTFDMKYDSEKCENLSDVDPDTGNHTYKSDYFALKINIPGYLYIAESQSKKNSVSFYDIDKNNHVSHISINLYSSSDGHNAKTWAEYDYKHNKDTLNETFVSFGKIEEQTLSGKTAYIYDYRQTYNGKDEITYDMFIDAGDYFYNISVSGQKDKIEKLKTKIYNSIEFEKIDSKKVGQLIRTDDDTITYKNYELKQISLNFKAPQEWQNISDDSGTIMLTDSYHGVLVTSFNKSSVNYLSVRECAYGLYRSAAADSRTSMSGGPASIKIRDKSGFEFDYLYTDENDDTYWYQTYVLEDNYKYVVVQFSVPEFAHGKISREIFKTIIESIDF